MNPHLAWHMEVWSPFRYYDMIYFGSDKMYRLKSNGRLE